MELTQSQRRTHSCSRFTAFLISVILSLFTTTPLLAVPANPQALDVSQPDGAVLKVHLRGDEYQHWAELATTGHTIIQNPESLSWEYADAFPDGSLRPTGIPARPDGQNAPSYLPRGLKPQRDVEHEQGVREMLEGLQKERLPQGSPGVEGFAPDAATPAPLAGTKKVLLVLVNFADRALLTTAGSWNSITFDGSPGTKSLVNYFKDNSFGTLTVSPAGHSQPGNPAGIVTVTVADLHPNSGKVFDYTMETRILNHALAEAAKYVDFAGFDTDGDMTLAQSELSIYFIYAGYEAAASVKTPNIWAHAWGGSGSVSAAGRWVNAWAVGGELNNVDARQTMGTIAHELGHSLCGLPDLYDTTNTNRGMGVFSPMAYGSWGNEPGESSGATPVLLDAWSRAFLGWSPPVSAANGPISLGSPLSSASTCKFINPKRDAGEYFLLEHRLPVGWDKGLTSNFGSAWQGGLLLLHVDEDMYDNAYHVGGHQLVVPVQANTANCEMLASGASCYGAPTTLFYQGNNSTWTAASIPNSNYYPPATGATGFSLTGISAPSAVMTAVYGADTAPPVVTEFALPATSTTTTVPVLKATVTDDVAITGYLVTEGSTPPAPDAAGWSPYQPASYTFATTGTKTLYLYARDEAWNVSAGRSATVTIGAATPALAIDVSVSRDTSTTGSTITSPAFSTSSANELLLAFVAAGNPSATAPATTVTGVTINGGGLTWVLVRRTNTQRGTAEVWRALASFPLASRTVTATLNQAVPSASITVVSFTGADTTGTDGSGAVGATASASGATGAPSATLVTSRANTWVFGVGNDWDGATARTVGPGQTMLHQFLSTSTADTYWVQRQTATTPAGGTTVTINDTAPTTHRYNLTAVEVLPLKDPSAHPVLAVSPTAIDFGGVPVGTTTPPRTILVSNKGDDVMMFAYSLDAYNSNDYVVTSTCTRNSYPGEYVLAPNQSCAINVSFKPVHTGTAGAAIYVEITRGVTEEWLQQVDVYLSGSGTASGPPVVVPYPASVAFGSQPVGTASQSVTVYINNNGEQPLAVSGISVTDAPGEFPFDSDCGSKTVLPGYFCTINVRFNPQAGGLRSGTLAILSNDPATPTLRVPLTGTGITSGVAVDISVSGTRTTAGTTLTSPAFTTKSPNELLLAFVSAGNPSSTAPATTVTTVSGGGLTWTLVRRTNTQRGSAEVWRAFAPAILTNVSVTATLNQSVPSGSITVVSYTGADTSGTDGSAAIGATASANALSGAPTASLVTTRAGSLVYGVGNDWTAGILRTVGAGQTMVHQLVSPTADTYWVQRQTNAIPAAGTTVTINDTAPTTDRYNLTVVEIRAPGASGPKATITPSSLAFGNLLINTTSAARTATLSNTGTTALTINSIAVTGTNAADFPLTNGCGTTLAAGASCTLSVRFAPVTAGARTASLTISSNDPANPSLVVALTGTGTTTPPPAALAIDATVWKDQGTAGTTIATAAFTTTAPNELLLAFVSAPTPTATSANTTVTGVTGGGLAWTLVQRTNTQRGTAEIWRAFAPTALTGAVVTATLNQSNPTAMMTVMSFKGVDTTGAGSGAVGAVGTGNAATGAPTASLVTTRANSLVLGVGNDWDGATARTVGAAQSLVHQYLAPSGDTFWVQRQTNTTSTAGTAVTINDTAPTNHRYNMSIVEVRTP